MNVYAVFLEVLEKTRGGWMCLYSSSKRVGPYQAVLNPVSTNFWLSMFFTFEV